MDSIKEKIPMIIAVIVAIALCGVAYYFLVYQQSNYYTQIDNSKIASIPETGGMKYEYTLDCYSENGKKKEIKFRTSRELKEDSYLKLEVMVKKLLIGFVVAIGIKLNVLISFIINKKN